MEVTLQETPMPSTPAASLAADPKAPAADPHSFRSFAEFYPFYLGEHSQRTCRRLHFIGSSLALACLAGLLFTGWIHWAWLALMCGYGCAWVGHFVFEHNKPASFKRPLYSFMGDWVMYRDMLAGRLSF
jgi:hypothetical protein